MFMKPVAFCMKYIEIIKIIKKYRLFQTPSGVLQTLFKPSEANKKKKFHYHTVYKFICIYTLIFPY